MNRLLLADGYVYRQEIELEDDNRKTYHYIDTPDKRTIEMPWSPYSTPSEEDLHIYVRLGFPKSERNLTSEKLRELIC